MSKPHSPAKIEEIVHGVPSLASNDAILNSCRLMLLAVEKDGSEAINEYLQAGLVSMGELRESFKAIVDKIEEVTFDNIVDLPRYSVLVATNQAQEPDRRAFFLEEGDLKFSLQDAIEHARRLTENNIAKWLFQIFTCLSTAFQRFITLRHLTLNRITLESDKLHFLSIVHFNKQFTKLRHGKYNFGRYKMNISKLDEDARHAWIHLIPSPDEEGFPFREDLYCRIHDTVRAGDLLLRSGQLNRVDSEGKKEELHGDYTDFVRRVQQNYRDFGLIALQLATRTLLTDDEMRRLRSYHYTPPVNKDLAKQPSMPSSSPPRGGTSSKNDNGRESPGERPPPSSSSPRRLNSRGGHTDGLDSPPRAQSPTARGDRSALHSAGGGGGGGGGEERAGTRGGRREGDFDIPTFQESEADMLKHICHDLSRWFPALQNCASSPVRDLVSLCFAPMTTFFTLHGTSPRSFPIPYLPRLKILLGHLRTQVLQHHRDTLYEPPDIWDEDVLKYREETKERYQQDMAEKARRGHERAHRRIQEERYKLWLSMQSDDYRRKREHRKKMMIVTRQHQRERDRLIHAALLHTWASPDLRGWLETALNQYFQLAEGFKAKMEKTDEEHRRKWAQAKIRHLQAQEAEMEKEKQELKLLRQRRKREAEEESVSAASQERNIDAVLHGGISRLLRQQTLQKAAVADPSTDKAPPATTTTPLPLPLPMKITDSSLLYHRVDDVHIKRILEEVYEPMDPYFTTKIVGTFCTGKSKAMVVKAMEEQAQQDAASSASSSKTGQGGAGGGGGGGGAGNGKKPSPTTTKNASTAATGTGTATAALTPALQRIQRQKQKKEEQQRLQDDESYRVHRMTHEEKVSFCFTVLAREWPTFFTSLCSSYELCTAMRKTLHAVEQQCAELEARGKFLVISDEQLFYKRNAMHSTHFQTLCPSLRASTFALCDAMQILDRARARRMVGFLASALMCHFVNEAQLRLAGELIAADRIRSFFRMICARKRLYPIIQEKSKLYFQAKATPHLAAGIRASMSGGGGGGGGGPTLLSRHSSSSAAVLANVANQAMATSRASIMTRQSHEDGGDEQRKGDTTFSTRSSRLSSTASASASAASSSSVWSSGHPQEPPAPATGSASSSFLVHPTATATAAAEISMRSSIPPPSQPSQPSPGPATPLNHNDQVLQQLLVSQKIQHQQQQHATHLAAVSDRAHTLSSHHSLHAMSAAVSAGPAGPAAGAPLASSLPHRPSFLTGGLQSLPELAEPPPAAANATEFATNRLMMVGMHHPASALSVTHVPAAVREGDHEDDDGDGNGDGDGGGGGGGEENDEGDDDDDDDFDEYEDDDEFVSIVSDVSALSIDDHDASGTMSTRKSARQSSRSKRRRSSRKVPPSASSPSSKQHVGGSVVGNALHAPLSRVSVMETTSSRHDKYGNELEGSIADDGGGGSSGAEASTATAHEKATAKTRKVPDKVITPFPVTKLDVLDCRGDALRVRIRLLAATRDYAEDLAQELAAESAGNNNVSVVTVYRPRSRSQPQQTISPSTSTATAAVANVANGPFASLQSSTSGSTPLFLSVKSMAQQTFETYGGFQDVFHRHRATSFTVLPRVEQYRVTWHPFVPSEDECKLLPLDVVPLPMRSKLSMKGSSGGSGGGGGGGGVGSGSSFGHEASGGGLQMISTKPPRENSRRGGGGGGAMDDTAANEDDDPTTAAAVIPLPGHCVDVEFTIVGLDPVHRYELYLTLDQKLTERLCRYYLPPLTTTAANKHPHPHHQQHQHQQQQQGLTKHEHPFQGFHHASIAHALKVYDTLTLAQRFARFMPTIPPPPAAIAAFTARMPYLSVMLADPSPSPSPSSSEQLVRISTASSIPEEANARINSTVALLLQSLQDHSHDTTTLMAMSFSQSCRTTALRPEVPAPLEVKLAYRSVGHAARLLPQPQPQRRHHYLEPKQSDLVVKAEQRPPLPIETTPSSVSSLLAFHLGDERPPSSSLRVLCHVTWPASTEDLPRSTQYEIQRRFVLRPLAQVDEWQRLGLIDEGGSGDGGGGVEDAHGDTSGAFVGQSTTTGDSASPTSLQQQQQRQQEDDEQREALRQQVARNKLAKRAFLADDDDDDDNGGDNGNGDGDGDGNEDDAVGRGQSDVTTGHRPSSAVDRVRLRSAKRRAQQPRPLSSTLTRTASRRYQQEHVIFGAWYSLPIVPTTTLRASLTFEDLFSLTNDVDSLLSTPLRDFLQRYVTHNRAVLSGVAPFQSLTGVSLLSSPTTAKQKLEKEETTAAHRPSSSGWCYAGYDVFVEYRVRVRNSVGESDFARHQVFYQPPSHYHADPQQQAWLNRATSEQESFRLGSLLLQSLLDDDENDARTNTNATAAAAAAAAAAGATLKTRSSRRGGRERTPLLTNENAGQRSQLPLRSGGTTSRLRIPSPPKTREGLPHGVEQHPHPHPVMVAAWHEQVHRQEQLESLQEELRRQQQREAEARQREADIAKAASASASSSSARGADIIAADDPWLKHLAFQSPFLLQHHEHRN